MEGLETSKRWFLPSQSEHGDETQHLLDAWVLLPPPKS